jgi:hypothetical protein
MTSAREYGEVLEDIAFDLKNGEDKKTIAGSLRAMADELDPPKFTFQQKIRMAERADRRRK